MFSFHELKDYIKLSTSHGPHEVFKFVGEMDGPIPSSPDPDVVWTSIDMSLLSQILKSDIFQIFLGHNISSDMKSSMAEMRVDFANHNRPTCLKCCNANLMFQLYASPNKSVTAKLQAHLKSTELKVKKGWSMATVKKSIKKVDLGKSDDPVPSTFPPSPLSMLLTEMMVESYCENLRPEHILEEGCAVCGILNLAKDMDALQDQDFDMNLLCDIDGTATRMPRYKRDDPIKKIDGPLLVPGCSKICEVCSKNLKKGKVPVQALVNGNWVGPIPDALKGLSFAEKMLISRVQHNACIVKVNKSGQFKLRANAIMFALPTPKVYTALPPPRKDMDDVLCYIFIGPTRPTESDHKCTPFLVRRNKVKHALEWLKLNHIDYSNLEIAYDNLEEYSEDTPPVLVDYRPPGKEKDSENLAVHDNGDNNGTQEGGCSFSVHMLDASDIGPHQSFKQMKALAMRHLAEGKMALGIGHAAEPESIFDHPQLYPMTMPWLFPYGLGGVGNNNGRKKVSDVARKKALLLYYDKRFQTDPLFPLLAFNHKQIKQSVSGGWLLTKQDHFKTMADRLLAVLKNTHTLESLIERMKDGENVKPATREESMCFDILNDLDFVAHKVDGSRTTKKYMRNQIWALISYIGAPSWFITFAPTDSRHPLCLYFAATDTTIYPKLWNKDDRFRMIANNPVACARFFKFMVELFIKHILGVGMSHPGVYGKTKGYYGTVEAQGRLTLHLHMLLWITGALTPQQVRDRLMEPDSEFEKAMIAYLESCCQGDFIAETEDEIKGRIARESAGKSVSEIEALNPTYTLPQPPPARCSHRGPNKSPKCYDCTLLDDWWNSFNKTTDTLLLKSNIHTCHSGCTNADHPTCKSRFPREMRESTTLDQETGALQLRHGHAMLNTFTASVTYLMRCNTDVTSLLSGTAIKSVIAYVTDYITKTPLRTHTMFEIMKTVCDRNAESVFDVGDGIQKARKLMVQLVNALQVKMEIGGPMASLYLLGHDDHYTNFQFKTFYWKAWTNHVRQVWGQEYDEHYEEKVRVDKVKGTLVGTSVMLDYKL